MSGRTCTKCRLRGQIEPLKGHKLVCPFASCACARCASHGYILGRQQNIPKHPGTSRNIPEHPGTSRNRTNYHKIDEKKSNQKNCERQKRDNK